MSTLKPRPTRAEQKHENARRYDPTLRVKSARRSMGLTQLGLAIRVGVAEETIQRIETGRTRRPQIDTRASLQCVLGIDVWEAR